jgi:hypothetical protein
MDDVEVVVITFEQHHLRHGQVQTLYYFPEKPLGALDMSASFSAQNHGWV